jgi:glutamine---fructose-6-phosphate transaminase (isomerizing)
MCGITGYIGKKEGLGIVLKNLKKLEYRGYDSAGVAFFDTPRKTSIPRGSSRSANKLHGKKSSVKLIRKVGKLHNLETAISGYCALPDTATIAHSRWATHGIPSETNAHPHHDCNKKIFLVHNGIIENYKELKDELIKKGHKFKTQTDTETLVHLIEEIKKNNGRNNFDKIIEKALGKVVGAYALAIINTEEPDKLYAARLGSPLVIGIGKNEYYIASDPSALAGLVKKVVYLKDNQLAVLSLGGFKVTPAKPKVEKLNIDPETAKKGDFPHFMLKEIFEGGEVVEASLKGRLRPNKHFIKLGGLESVTKKLREIKQCEIIACGTSYYAGMIGELLFEDLANIPTDITLASEYRYRNIPYRKKSATFFISQSGETADTLAALKKVKRKKILSLGIVNAVGSSIARETTAGVYNHAGPEIGVASTKAFLSQITVLSLIALHLRPSKSKLYREFTEELSKIPSKINKVLKDSDNIKKLVRKYLSHNNFFYLGRGYNYPVALEGALKLKEISYAHAEGYAGGEMKHGPIALIDKNFPVIAIATKNRLYEKMISNLEEIKARGGKIIAIATTGDKKIKSVADQVIYVPKTIEQLEPLVNVVPLQLFAYHFGTLKGIDVDKPRNLAKSVTVE